MRLALKTQCDISRARLNLAGSQNARLIMSKNGKQCGDGLDQRCRDLDGEIRQKRRDTLVKTLRKTYGPDFAPGVRGDMRLDTLRERAGGSLSQLIKKR
jgi:hypothetical protein